MKQKKSLVDKYNTAFDAIRREIDATGYGHWVKDEQVLKLAKAVIDDLEAMEKK